MDPLSHLIVTGALLGADSVILATAVLPDLPFYSTYPLWVARCALLPSVLEHGIWPAPPRWIVLLHRLSHAMPVALVTAWIVSRITRQPVQRVLAAWLLHILVDIPHMLATLGGRDRSGRFLIVPLMGMVGLSMCRPI